MLAKGLILIVLPLFIISYVVGVKTLRVRLLLLGALIICLAITIPNCQHDRAFFMERHVTNFTCHVEMLLMNKNYELASRKVHQFNAMFPIVARDTESCFDFINNLIKNTNSLTVIDGHAPCVERSGEAQRSPQK